MAYKANETDMGAVERSDDIRRQIERMYVELNVPFEPLGEAVRRDYDIAHGPAMRDLVKQCKNRSVRLPEALESVSDGWRDGLTEDAMSEYCAAVSGLMESRLLNSGAPIAEAQGILVNTTQEPCFEIMSRPGSLLEEEAGALEGNVHVYRVCEFAEHVAARCEVDLGMGELAWRFIAALLPEIDSAVFPGITTRRLDRHVLVELRQVPR